MSALTESPSPATSPRTSFHIQSRGSTDHLSRHSPRLTFTSGSSPRRSLHAPSPSTNSGPSARKPREDTAPTAPDERPGRYVHAGTQYSPDGYPPTASRTVAAAKPNIPSGSEDTTSKKRKDREQGIEESMTNSSVGGSGGENGGVESSSSNTGDRVLPPEPELRVDPKLQDSEGKDATEHEPQEARSTHGHSSAPKRSKPEPGDVKIMPLDYSTSNAKDLGVLISSMLMELIRLNDQIPLRDGRLTRFHSRAPPGISVSDYLQRLIYHATLSPPILLSMVWYIDRLCQLYPAFTINSLTVHRFLITAATVAAKGLSDIFWTNPTYARIGGIPVSELATLELEFLQKVQWRIVPQPEILEDYYRSLVDRTEGFELVSAPDSSSGGDSADEAEDEEEADEEGEENMVIEPS